MEWAKNSSLDFKLKITKITLPLSSSSFLPFHLHFSNIFVYYSVRLRKHGRTFLSSDYFHLISMICRCTLTFNLQTCQKGRLQKFLVKWIKKRTVSFFRWKFSENGNSQNIGHPETFKCGRLRQFNWYNWLRCVWRVNFLFSQSTIVRSTASHNMHTSCAELECSSWPFLDERHPNSMS